MRKIVGFLVLMLCFSVLSVRAGETQFTQKEMYIRQIFADNYNYSPSGFFEAIKDGSISTVDLFLKSGMDPNTTYMKLPAIYYAIKSKNPVIVDMLLKAGVNPNQKYMSQTPLFMAIGTKNVDTVNTLIKHGANVNEDSFGLYPLSYAIVKKDSDVIERLLDSGAMVTEDSLRRALKLKDENVKNLVLKTYKQQ
ncbi:ankyrin repeat domain-containing protein [bacterium]|nr:ankyrin repeat domain-containing protein [bacterium]